MAKYHNFYVGRHKADRAFWFFGQPGICNINDVLLVAFAAITIAVILLCSEGTSIYLQKTFWYCLQVLENLVEVIHQLTVWERQMCLKLDHKF